MIRPLLVFALLIVAVDGRADDSAPPRIEVYKTPGCGCCEKWIAHLRDAGFTVTPHDAPNLDAIRKRLGVPRTLAGCHTASVAGYAIEGHVPARQIKRLLREKPEVAGISVPGMPVGSPGMEGPGGRSYEVMSWSKDGGERVYAREEPVGR